MELIGVRPDCVLRSWSRHPDGIERLIAEGAITETDLVGAERLLYEDGVGYYAAP